MPRIYRRLPFMAEAKEQVRGGLWYKPSWYDAMRKVPPLPVEPAIKKREVPRMVFVEDRLIREFEERNPMITAHDHYDPFHPDPEQQGTVASQFAAKQVQELKADKTETEAYEVAKSWLIENGPSFYKRLDPPEELRKSIEGEDVMNMPPKEMYETMMRRQMNLVKQGLERGSSRHTTKGQLRTKPKYRSFLSKDEIKRIQERRLGTDVVDVEVKGGKQEHKPSKSSEEELFEPLTTAGGQLDVDSHDEASHDEDLPPTSEGDEDDLSAGIGEEGTQIKQTSKKQHRSPKGFVKRRHARKPLTTTPEDDDADMR